MLAASGKLGGEVEEDEEDEADEDEEPERVAMPTPVVGQPVVSPVESGTDATSRALARLRRTLE